MQKGYEWLLAETAPRALVEAVKLHGTLERPGRADNPVIVGWADDVAKAFPGGYNNWAAEFYADDEIPWCGLYMAKVHAAAGRKPPDKYLSALAWRSYGVPADRPMLGDVMVKSRAGGGHVTMYVGEDGTHYHCLGGNQSDQVNIVRYPKAIDWTIRRSAYTNRPPNVRVVTLAAGGAPSAGSEA